MVIYAIGDVHGQRDMLCAAHERIAADKAREGAAAAPVVHIGDYVDRGPDSRGVIEHLIACRAAGEPMVLLRGNHDRLMADYLRPAPAVERAMAPPHWLSGNIGGRATLASYGVGRGYLRGWSALHRAARAAVPAGHRAFLDGLCNCYHAGDLFFAHAGIRPGVPLDAQDEEDLLWIRYTFLDDRRDHGALIVHGHTPVHRVTHAGNRVNIDTGAAWGRPLSAVAIEAGAVWELTGAGRVPVVAGG